MTYLLLAVIALLITALCASFALTRYYKGLYMVTDGLLQSERRKLKELNRKSLDREFEGVFGEVDAENLKDGWII
jgi:hypothetical protein